MCTASIMTTFIILIIKCFPVGRYTSQPDLYFSRSASAAVNLAYIPEEGSVARPPPCYTSQPNLAGDLSNMSICSSVEPPPSYTSHQDNTRDFDLDANITEGTINLSFLPDECDISLANLQDTSADTLRGGSDALDLTQSTLSMKSWADNLDADMVSLGSTAEDLYSVPYGRRPSTDYPSSQKHKPYHATSSPYQVPKPQTVMATVHQSSQSQDFQFHSHPHHYNYSSKSSPYKTNGDNSKKYVKRDYNGVQANSKLASRVQRAKALGREYSSTPVLTATGSVTNQNPALPKVRRKSMQNGSENDAIISDALKSAKAVQDKGSKSRKYDPVDRKVQSALGLDKKNDMSSSKTYLQGEALRAQSTSNCNTQHNLPKVATGSQGLKFWRNNKASISKACVSQVNHESIRELDEIADNNPLDNIPHNALVTSLSHNTSGKNTSHNATGVKSNAASRIKPNNASGGNRAQHSSDMLRPSVSTKLSTSHKESGPHTFQNASEAKDGFTPSDLPLQYPKVPSKQTSHSLSQLYILNKEDAGSNSSINSWLC